MHRVKLLEKKDVAQGTMAFWFEKPAGYNFVAGQHTTWQLINPSQTDAQGDSREFSFASTPHEDNLMIASRMRDTAFKRVLHNLPLGTEIEVGEPEGDFVLHSDHSHPAVFIAGGIGTTPFRSMILDAPTRKIILLAINRTPEETPFLNELGAINIFTSQTGHPTFEIIKGHLSSTMNGVYYVAGPGKMVHAMRNLLLENSVDDLYIKTEDFEGY